jgi:hypothetical protein
MSLKVSEQVEGGFIDNVDAVLTFETCEFDYNGSVAVPVPALHVSITYDKDGSEETKEEYYSAGKPEKVQPTSDGKGFDIEGDKGLSQNCKAAQFLKSLVDAGLDEDEYLGDNDVTKMDGIGVHLERRPDASSGFGSTEKKDRTILLVTKINHLPGEAPKGAKAKPTPTKATTTKPAAGKPAPAKPGAKPKGLEAQLVPVIEEILSEADENTVAKSELSKLVFDKVKGNPELKANLRDLTKLSQNEEFLGDDARPWAFDGEQLVGAS